MGLKLLWATDGSEESEQVLPALNHLLLPAADRLYILVVAPRPVVSSTRLDPAMLLWDLVPGYQERVTAEVTRIAEEAAALVPPGVAQVETLVRLGRPLDEIDLVAREVGADVVLVGARGHSGLATLLLGSLSQALLHRVPCSVLVGRPGGIPRTILLATDGPASNQPPEALLAALPPPAGAQVTVLAVESPGGAAAAADRLRAAGWNATPLERAGDPADRILRVAEDLDADLIVMGSLSRRPPGRFLLGSTAARVAQHASCSVLVVRTRQ